jgi:hypothetical protein
MGCLFSANGAVLISNAVVAKQQQLQRVYLNPTNFLRGKRRKAARLNFLAAFLAFNLPP